MEKSKIAILASWSFVKVGSSYYCPSTHYVYLKEVSKLYRHIYMISTCIVDNSIPSNRVYIDIFNITVEELPMSKSYLDAQRYKKEYKNAILKIDSLVDVFYCRVPDPFCWLPARLSIKPVIMHFVGDTVDATKHNVNWSWLKKKIMLTGFYPELRRIKKSAKLADKVCTNGIHIANKLKKQGIKAIPVISSTISREDCVSQLIPIKTNPFKLIYVGYLRYAKGIDTLIEVINKLSDKSVDFTFDVIGDGDMYDTLEGFINKKKLTDRVFLHGRVDDRSKLFDLLRQSDLFFFSSLSEGSPRVVIEAMSQGLPVISTPVGSLPLTFKENEEIYFFPYNDADAATSKIIEIIEDLDKVEKIRFKTLERVKEEFTISKFIEKVFTL